MSGSQSSLREANRALIVETVHRHGGLTQVELAGSTGLSAATVSTIVKELLAAGVVDTRNTTRSGRRAQMVTIAHRVGLAVGIHIGPRHLRIALGDVMNEVVAEQTLPLPNEHRVDTSLDRAALLVADLLERVGSTLDEVVGIGVGLPAPVDSATGMVSVRGIMRGWDEIHVGHVLSKRLGCPVFVDNDANLGALAESTHGASRDVPRLRLRAGVVRDRRRDRASAARCTAGSAGPRARSGTCRWTRRATSAGAAAAGASTPSSAAPALLEPLRSSHGTLALRDVIQRAIEGDPGCARVIADAGSIIGEVVVRPGDRGQPAVHRRRGRARRDGGAPARPAARGDPPARAAQPDRARSRWSRPSSASAREVVGALELVLRSTDFVVRSDEQARAAGTSCAGEQEMAH